MVFVVTLQKPKNMAHAVELFCYSYPVFRTNVVYFKQHPKAGQITQHTNHI
jgi:hypothetical protein